MSKILSPEEWFLKVNNELHSTAIHAYSREDLMRSYGQYVRDTTLEVAADDCHKNTKKQEGCGFGKNGSILALKTDKDLEI